MKWSWSALKQDTKWQCCKTMPMLHAITYSTLWPSMAAKQHCQLQQTRAPLMQVTGIDSVAILHFITLHSSTVTCVPPLLAPPTPMSLRRPTVRVLTKPTSPQIPQSRSGFSNQFLCTQLPVLWSFDSTNHFSFVEYCVFHKYLDHETSFDLLAPYSYNFGCEMTQWLVRLKCRLSTLIWGIFSHNG